MATATAKMDIIVTNWRVHIYLKQECIPVGCVPSTAVAVWGVCPKCMLEYVCPSGGVCPSACWDMSAQGGVCPSVCWDMSAQGMSAPVHAGICLPRGYLPQCILGYVCLGGVCPSACWDTPPLPPSQNHSCLWKHNLSATTLLMVKTCRCRRSVNEPLIYPHFHLLQAVNTETSWTNRHFNKSSNLAITKRKYIIIWPPNSGNYFFPLQYCLQDDKCLAKPGVKAVMELLVDEDVDVILGPICSTGMEWGLACLIIFINTNSNQKNQTL